VPTMEFSEQKQINSPLIGTFYAKSQIIMTKFGLDPECFNETNSSETSDTAARIIFLESLPQLNSPTPKGSSCTIKVVNTRAAALRLYWHCLNGAVSETFVQRGEGLFAFLGRIRGKLVYLHKGDWKWTSDYCWSMDGCCSY